MFNPASTYRLQLHEGFTLSDLQRLIPYFQKLGVKTLYASPVFKAVPGSRHGYDVVNPNQVNPEIGTTEQLKEISSLLAESGISWLQDIVPNHMAYHCTNAWLMDVLKNGRASQYASFFDITWNGDASRLMAPILGGTPEEAVSAGELKLALAYDTICFRYGDHYFPLKEGSLMQLEQLNKELAAAVDAANADPALLIKLAGEQHYELICWQETDRRINYRRFFTVNGLICMNVQNPAVAEEAHQLTQALIAGKVVQGLRVDHIDGLYDPAAYLNRLRDLSGQEAYVVVEKILEPGESLPQDWPIQGTTGYDFLALVNNLLTSPHAAAGFSSFYEQLVADKKPVQEQAFEKKSLILQKHMGGELQNLCNLFIESGLLQNPGVQEEDLKKVIAGFLVHCPVYRYYAGAFPLKEAEAQALKKIFESVKKTEPGLAAAVDAVEAVFTGAQQRDADQLEKTLHLYRRCMQFTGPIMAKGVEDTLMYTFNRFIGHNDVGDSPASFGISAENFHEKMLLRHKYWPLTLNATSTHDTKRGEDVRARLNVLSDLPEEWLAHVKEWQRHSMHLKQNNAPDANDEYFIYQTIAGAYPLEQRQQEKFAERLEEYLRKALREAKAHSNWSAPGEAYEAATIGFSKKLLDDESYFMKSFCRFQKKISDHGIINSLAQLILKFTCPGVPDTYQGTELWDLSLVDPDNRRAVDYAERQQYLCEIKNAACDATLLEQLWEQRHTGKIKLYFLQRLLELRKEHVKLFEKGAYLPLKAAGKFKEHVFAFARRHGNSWCLVAVPLHTALLNKNFPAFDWKDTSLILPEGAPKEWQHLLLDVKGKANDPLLLNTIFNALPFAVLKMQQPQNERGAGLLMPVSALPSPFGIGDMGPGARQFVDFLSRSAQKYWQLLPLNPTHAQQGYSPYSSVSSMAGNVLLISPELLLEDGLLDEEALEEKKLPQTDAVDYEQSRLNKSVLLETAYRRFQTEQPGMLQKEFADFCAQEAYWLQDFARFERLAELHEQKPWYEWPAHYRDRDPARIEAFDEQEAAALALIKWQQYIFQRQWHALRDHCSVQGVKLFGDLPFYVSHNSAEVWADRSVFSLDETGKMTGLCGVPPDYFSKTGQLWNMPTYNWNELKANRYDWWIRRLRKNVQLFDLLRIDHFRALDEYWEVPAGESTAVNGRWLKGPGTDFFETALQELGALPFVAEDLGDNMESVYKLREAVNLPGMKVLQFAFGENLPTAVDIPHNFTTDTVVYTGTHDNNTTLGWYRHETKAEDRKRLEQYTGQRVSEKNINTVLAKMAYASVAKIAMLPMQDLLNLDEGARMNTPGSDDRNWAWRLSAQQLNNRLEKQLRDLARFYNRL